MLAYCILWFGLLVAAAGALLAQPWLAAAGLLAGALAALPLRPVVRPQPVASLAAEPAAPAPSPYPPLLQAVLPAWTENLGQVRHLVRDNIGRLFERAGATSHKAEA